MLIFSKIRVLIFFSVFYSDTFKCVVTCCFFINCNNLVDEFWFLDLIYSDYLVRFHSVFRFKKCWHSQMSWTLCIFFCNLDPSVSIQNCREVFLPSTFPFTAVVGFLNKCFSLWQSYFNDGCLVSMCTVILPQCSFPLRGIDFNLNTQL